MSFIVTYNGQTDRSIGAHATARPSVPAPVRTVTQYGIKGRDGNLYERDGTVNDISIPVSFGFYKSNPNDFGTQYRALKKWLFSDGNGRLSFSDDAGMFFKVKNVIIEDSERVSRRIGLVRVLFVCDGYTYLTSGLTAITPSGTIVNAYATSHPKLEISGNGTCEITMNNKVFTVTVSTKAYIDTDLMITLNNDSAWANTTVTGDYEDLWLKPGSNSFAITSGFTCSLTPNWRCL